MDLIELLPDYYEYNETMKTLQAILSEQTEVLDTGLIDMINQCYVESADDLLTRHEVMLGIAPDVAKSDRYRRERIKAKMAGAGTTTASLIEGIAVSFTNAEIEVLENFLVYTVTIRFVGMIGIPGNIGDIRQSIEEAIPAHLQVLYEYIYNTHTQTATFTHGELSAYTHYEIRNGRIKSRLQAVERYQHIELSQLTHIAIAKGDLPNGN